ncbi:Radical SAM domain protein [Pseudodesulfovibrio mercurii]|uniref:Radical SAM domain protein n=1 Tax=Pseudodesulfovibrio mercurii TaxID=641491 RepID=F0JC56_9BACT|nr:radical SAM protein [Pseudodesulfovibrio mercurii]EGB15629.1 Radical SAM domain protein [Pseudodesulfovibrio mercurii]
MPEPLVFAHPEPAPAPTRIWPVFLPFAGCPHRCLFCAQDRQTGRDRAVLAPILADLERDLDAALAGGRGPYELAFYGGTFTALPAPWPEAFLALAARFRERGLVTRVRCSTRPDRTEPAVLDRCRALGLDLVELGIQSFDDAALAASGRGYGGGAARRGCARVVESGLALGVQLLPGLPGDREGLFQADVREAAALHPETARLYPCLVIEGTDLARAWRRGEYVPWAVDRARDELARALPVLWGHGVRVIRLGLAPEGTLTDAVLAGPWHPALGQTARSLALLSIIRRKVAELGRGPVSLTAPRRYQGELFGQANELAPAYAALGLPRTRVRFADTAVFSLA